MFGTRHSYNFVGLFRFCPNSVYFQYEIVEKSIIVAHTDGSKEGPQNLSFSAWGLMVLFQLPFAALCDPQPPSPPSFPFARQNGVLDVFHSRFTPTQGQIPRHPQDHALSTHPELKQCH